MNEIVRSRNAMLLASLGAVLGALAEVLSLIAFAVLNINNDTTYLDLGHAHDWVFFGGSLLVLGAVGLVAWERIAQSSLPLADRARRWQSPRARTVPAAGVRSAMDRDSVPSCGYG